MFTPPPAFRGKKPPLIFRDKTPPPCDFGTRNAQEKKQLFCGFGIDTILSIAKPKKTQEKKHLE